MIARLRLAGAGMLAFTLILAACGKSPERAAQEFYEAFERHEFVKAKEYVCPALEDELDAWIREVGVGKHDVALDVEYQEVEKDGDRVVIRVTGTKRLGEQTWAVDYRIRLEKRDGWKVCDMQFAPPTP